jgi:hypothetical protein
VPRAAGADPVTGPHSGRLVGPNSGSFDDTDLELLRCLLRFLGLGDVVFVCVAAVAQMLALGGLHKHLLGHRMPGKLPDRRIRQVPPLDVGGGLDLLKQLQDLPLIPVSEVGAYLVGGGVRAVGQPAH